MRRTWRPCPAGSTSSSCSACSSSPPSCRASSTVRSTHNARPCVLRAPKYAFGVVAHGSRILHECASGKPVTVRVPCRACAGVRAIAAQEEPIRRVLSRMEVADGLTLEKVRFTVLALHGMRCMRGSNHHLECAVAGIQLATPECGPVTASGCAPCRSYWPHLLRAPDTACASDASHRMRGLIIVNPRTLQSNVRMQLRIA